ncbi:MAG: 50S ribosomal protein L6 [Legionellales bacterium]|nr:50S ribosomal protein L6 [Legionellales bacterium]|tara:strand:+ start:7426 stop:7959 length:534 start_codon:yes stop_codon:yes gene_type:complete
MASRIAKKPIELPKGVEFKLTGSEINVKGPKGSLNHELPRSVSLAQNDNVLQVEPKNGGKEANMMAGTTRAIVNNMVVGVSDGFEKKLTLIGVGYRAQVKGKSLNLTLGFSHPVDHAIPEGITIECPSQTEIVVKGANKQQVGQVAAEIRAYRPPEPYKGKGVRYADEHVIRKETKK